MPRRLGPVFLTGLLWGLSFPPFNLHHLIWISLVPLLSIKPTPKFFDGLCAGVVAWLLILSWTLKTFAAAQIQGATAISVWILFALLHALYPAIFCLAYGRLQSHWAKPWIGAGIWVSLDIVRTTAFTGFPWAFLAHTQAYNLPLLQLAAFTGAHGITFLIVAFNCIAADLLRPKFHRLQLAVVVAAIVGSYFLGRNRMRTFSRENGGTIKIALLQGNIDQYEKWTPAYESKIKSRYESLALEAAQEKPDLIIWPESAVPGWIPNEADTTKWLSEVVAKTKTFNIVGAVSARGGNDYNSAFLLGPAGEFRNVYDKQHMVPFGEYIPFGGFLKRWIPYLGQLGVFAGGKFPTLFTVGPVTAAPTICYEVIFPGLVKRDVRQGANLLVNITNDGWFLDTGAPEQHFVANIFRAVENRVPVARAANTGISAIIDPCGRILVRSPLLKSGVYAANVFVCYTPPHVARTSKSN